MASRVSAAGGGYRKGASLGVADSDCFKITLVFKVVECGLYRFQGVFDCSVTRHNSFVLLYVFINRCLAGRFFSIYQTSRKRFDVNSEPAPSLVVMLLLVVAEVEEEAAVTMVRLGCYLMEI